MRFNPSILDCFPPSVTTSEKKKGKRKSNPKDVINCLIESMFTIYKAAKSSIPVAMDSKFLIYYHTLGPSGSTVVAIEKLPTSDWPVGVSLGGCLDGGKDQPSMHRISAWAEEE